MQNEAKEETRLVRSRTCVILCAVHVQLCTEIQLLNTFSSLESGTGRWTGLSRRMA